ncbi:hypothetical protein [Sulfurovum sp. NBC37-1]|uniref:hypothetical protein n=1 Tax=Sulfurovum sp. (strain NBC37-1) TaxID=387093 RepID=UPI00015879B1|nr:hypothetical protein [Sulfurovum sp. NBC37-1]BAF72963.1 hypothetical protein SUN_2021 [Sulfurovum sp. NBC37-1]
MKTVIKVSLMVMMLVGMLQAERLKWYAVKSGKVTYDISGEKEIKALGIKENIKGKKRIIFDDYGNKEIVEFKKIIESKSRGKSTFAKEHEMTYTNGINQYHVNFDRNRIKKVKNPYFAANYTLVDGKDIQAFMPKAKKAGIETVAGVECTVWKKKNESMCIYKGIVLKHYSDGETTVASKLEFDVPVGQDDFKLPDFPAYDKQGNEITLEQSTIENEDKADNTSKTKKGASTAIEAGLIAAQKAGFKGKKLFDSNVKMTKEQEQAAGVAMANFDYPKQKQKVLKKEKAMRFAKKCLSGAKDKSQASQCVFQIEEMGGWVEFNNKWDEKIKKDILADVDEFLNVRVPCAKSSYTGNVYRKCREEKK